MTDEIKVQTPEDISLAFYPAGLATRFIAFLIDFVIQYAVIFLLVIALFYFWIIDFFSDSQTKWIAIIILTASIFLLNFAYFILFEWLRDGQTPGKKWMRIRVIRDGAFPINGIASLIRNLFRIIDQIPLFWVVPLLSQSHKRIGDYIAGTLVISAKEEAREVPIPGESYSTLSVRNFQFGAEDLRRLRRKDFRMLEEFLRRREHLSPDLEIPLREKILLVCQKQLKREIPQDKSEEFIKELYLFLREERRRKIL